MHSDFIHTVRGEPIYFETTDNFTDLRQRFFGVSERARKALQWPLERRLTFVVDRGIYGTEFFERVIDQAHLHLITWQKGFVAQRWDPGKVMGRTTITRFRNSSTDWRRYQFEYVEGAGEQNPKWRQIVVQATDYQGRTIQVAILTADLDRSQKKETDQLKRHLLAEEQALQAHQSRAQKRQALEGQWAQAGTPDTPQHQRLSRGMAALKTADQRYEKAREERRRVIEQSHQRIQEIQVQITETQAKESRLEALIAAQMVRMDSQCKRLLDVLRITARNLFYQALQPFKQAYDNYRDDHDHFRKLTQSPGVLEVSAERILIHLLPRTNYGSGLRKIVNQTLEAINAKGMEHPCLPGRKLKFRLGQRAEMEVKMNVED